MAVKSTLLLLVVQGTNAVTSHTSSANRGPSPLRPSVMRAGSTNVPGLTANSTAGRLPAGTAAAAAALM